jgi:hypothetical protein
MGNVGGVCCGQRYDGEREEGLELHGLLLFKAEGLCLRSG